MFTLGDKVKIAVHTESWMQGFTHGRVVKVGRKWITVEWDKNDKIKRKFSPSLLELA